MLADFSLQACCNLTVTKMAAAFKAGRIRNGYQWLMRVGMTVKALYDRLARTVGSIMAAGAFRHDLSIVAAQWIIGMKNFMTFCAGKYLMPGTVIEQPVIMARVTASAFRQ